MIIKDKKDSVAKMKELGLNYFPLDVFAVNDLNAIENFFKTYPAKEYVMRSANKAKGDFCFVTNFEEAKKNLHRFEEDVTICVSYNEFKEDVKGRIKPGYYADMVVLDKDIFTCDPMEIKDILPVMTMVGGHIVFEA
jgi:hypothetical protein